MHIVQMNDRSSEGEMDEFLQDNAHPWLADDPR